eukprot:GHVN01062265.1.p1 GENE.GHVN01062265.1~~GHVN01062265.1.p1  ORF type:complete len:171 (-),score=13.90 GHVN01062265.1:138-650(-)
MMRKVTFEGNEMLLKLLVDDTTARKDLNVTNATKVIRVYRELKKRVNDPSIPGRQHLLMHQCVVTKNKTEVGFLFEKGEVDLFLYDLNIYGILRIRRQDVLVVCEGDRTKRYEKRIRRQDVLVVCEGDRTKRYEKVRDPGIEMGVVGLTKIRRVRLLTGATTPGKRQREF